MIVNANSIVQLSIRIKTGIMMHVNESVKGIESAQIIIPGILVHVFVRMISI